MLMAPWVRTANEHDNRLWFLRSKTYGPQLCEERSSHTRRTQPSKTQNTLRCTRMLTVDGPLIERTTNHLNLQLQPKYQQKANYRFSTNSFSIKETVSHHEWNQHRRKSSSNSNLLLKCRTPVIAKGSNLILIGRSLRHRRPMRL